MNKAELVALKERIDAASKGIRQLDHDIALSIGGWTYTEPSGGFYHSLDKKHQYVEWRFPAYTASIDAALALVQRVLPSMMENIILIALDRVEGMIVKMLPLAILSALLAALIERQPEDAA